jgi:hypothetical protein
MKKSTTKKKVENWDKSPQKSGIRVYMLDCWLWDVVDCMSSCRRQRLLAILATGERSRGELASELGISS